jgi:hypothetical protein
MENKTTLIRAIVQTIDWKNRAEGEWHDRACWRLDRLVDMLPHGSGIDSTSEIIDYKMDKNGNCTMVSFRSDYHHMNADGYYDGWTQHTVKVYPDWAGVRLNITGRNRNDIKDYLHATWDYALSQDIDMPINW